MRGLRWQVGCSAIALVLTACGLLGTPAAGEARSGVARAPATVAEARSAAASINQFGFDLLRPDLVLAKGNVVVSPWSIGTVLGMARVGARGATADEIAKVVHAGDVSLFDQAMNGLDQQLGGRNGTFTGPEGKLHVDLTSADRAFVQKKLTLEKPFLDQLARSYGVGVGLVDYIGATETARKQVNAWVSGQTHGRIKELVKSLNQRTRLLLVNAVYLKADWKLPFRKDATVPATFHAPEGDTSVAFMHDSESRRYAAGDGWQAVELAYAGDKLGMDVIVPDAGRFDEFARTLSPAVLEGLDKSEPVEVELSLPKWDFEYKVGLKDRLSDLGMPTAFDEGAADFSGITTRDKLSIADVIHQANVTVDEKGTVAAAATAAVFQSVGAALSTKHLDVDRPYIFLIRDLPTGAILFAGQVTNPSAKG